MAMRNKYYSKKVTVDGQTFDSKKEYKRYCELLLLEKGGAITELKRQVAFTVIPAQRETIERYSPKTGKRLKDKEVIVERECAYVADFTYKQDGKLVVEDTKGFRTKDYIIKRKLMYLVYGIKIKEI